MVVVGDATLDVTLRPSQPLRPGSDVPARILVSPGGQGANVAVRLARQAIRVRLITALGTDAAGQLLRQALEHERVELAVPSGAATGSVVSLVDSDGERTMASDRVPLDAAEMVAAVAAEPRAAAVFEERLIHARPDLLLLSADEAGALVGADQDSLSAAASDLAARLATRLPDLLVIVTGGSRGSAAAGAGLSIVEQAPPVEEPMIDATGAGDAYAAALIAGLLGAAWPPSQGGLQAAMAAASRLGALVSRVVGAQALVSGEREPLP